MTPQTSYHSIIIWKGNSYSPAQFRLYVHELLEQDKEDWEKDILLFILEWMDDDKNVFQIQTSGSTGKPKIVNIDRQAMINSALATGSFLGLKAAQSALLCLPAKYIAGKMMIVRSLVLGMDLHYIKPTVDSVNSVNKSFDFCAMIPLQIQYAIDKKEQYRLDKIKTIIVGGAAISEKYIDSLQDLNTQFFATYGMTETITHIALQKLNGNDKSSHFKCLRGVQVDLDERACLAIKSHSLANKQIITNDLAELISPTEFKILGRIDFIINSGGLKINPIQIEEKIAHLISTPFMIGYKNDKKLGQKVVLLIESNQAIQNQQSLLHEIENCLPPNHAPKEIIYIPQLKMTENKKVDRFKNNLFINK